MSIDLIIASFRIRLIPAEGLTLIPGERFHAFEVAGDGTPDVILRVSCESYTLPSQSVLVFDAPLMDSDGKTVIREPFWEVWRDGEKIIVRVTENDKTIVSHLVIDIRETVWDLFLGSSGDSADPLPYPLDGLVIYYMVMKRRAFMIHASAVNHNGRGWLFSGRSGKGKTTIARLFDNAGTEVIHDDRLIVLKRDDGWYVYSTPVYRNDIPRYARLDHMWLIDHGTQNTSVPVQGARAVALIMANCIQQNWDVEFPEMLISRIQEVVEEVPVSRLSFVPDSSLCRYLFIRQGQYRVDSIHAFIALLKEGHNVTATAGGLSMWPAIIPGDKPIVEPLDRDNMPGKGEVIALIRDGSLVIHRIIAVTENGGRREYITRGDASVTIDDSVSESEVAGVVRSFMRDGKVKTIGKRRMPAGINRLLALSRAFFFAWRE